MSYDQVSILEFNGLSPSLVALKVFDLSCQQVQHMEKLRLRFLFLQDETLLVEELEVKNYRVDREQDAVLDHEFLFLVLVQKVAHDLNDREKEPPSKVWPVEHLVLSTEGLQFQDLKSF